MTAPTPALPYGIRDIKLRPLTGETLGTAVDLPVGRTLSFKENEDFEQLEGDDRIMAIHGKGAMVDWDLEAGGISFAAWALMSGANLTETGVSPNQQRSLVKHSTDARPYFQIEGQSIGDSGGDVHVIIERAKVTGDLEGEFAYGTFQLTKASGQGIGRVSDDLLWRMTQNETAVVIGDPVNEVQTVSVNATGGTFTLTYDTQTTGNIAYNASAAAVQTALEALSNIAVGDVAVSGPAGGPYVVTFIGTLGASDVDEMTADSTNLTGGTHTASVATTVAGG